MYQSFPQRHYVRSTSAMPVVREMKNEQVCEEKKAEICEKPCEKEKEKNNPLKEIFSSLEIDDLIIIGILLMLLYEGTNDFLVIGILAIILFF